MHTHPSSHTSHPHCRPLHLRVKQFRPTYRRVRNAHDLYRRVRLSRHQPSPSRAYLGASRSVSRVCFIRAYNLLLDSRLIRAAVGRLKRRTTIQIQAKPRPKILQIVGAIYLHVRHLDPTRYHDFCPNDRQRPLRRKRL